MQRKRFRDQKKGGKLPEVVQWAEGEAAREGQGEGEGAGAEEEAGLVLMGTLGYYVYWWWYLKSNLIIRGRLVSVAGAFYRFHIP